MKKQFDEQHNFYSQVDQSDIGSDRILPDPTIRRNPIGFRVSESLTDPMNGFFVGFRRTVRRNPTKSDEIRSNPILRIR